MITFKFSGADGVMTVAETLTSGMVGKQVKLEFTSDWDNLTKTAVFEAGDISVAVYNVGDTATIPEAVLSIPLRRLRVGIYGEDAEGNITPTIYANGPRIEVGADPYRASATEPPMPKWVELEARIEDLENGNTGGGSGSGSSQNVTLTTAQINALDGMFKVCAFIKEDVSAEYAAFQAAFGISDSGGSGEDSGGDSGETEVTLTSISATYSGGDVTVGTAVTDLTGIVVTAHYSDGTSQTVTGYTLSGTIVEGSNTVTVSYQGKTTTFTVTGVAESGGDDSGGEETGVSNETTWTDGVAYTYTPVENVYIETDGSFKDYSGWSRTPYLYCEGAAKLRSECVISSGTITGGSGNYSAFYDAGKNYVSSFNPSACGSEVGAFVDIEIPANAVYFIFSHKNNVMGIGHANGPYLKLTPYA